LPNWALKTAMAATGTALAAVLSARLVANLWFYAGPDSYNLVTTRLRYLFVPVLPAGAWLLMLRIVVVALLATHVVAGVTLTLRARRFRPRRQGGEPARSRASMRATLTRLMPWTGALIGLFAVFYLIDQVLFEAPPAADAPLAPGGAYQVVDSYGPLAGSLSVAWIAAAYVIGLLAIGAHALHGLDTVSFIAAGPGAFARRVRKWLTPVGVVVFGALLVAGLLIPLGLAGGWLR